ncbi:hypothetical protein CROQUDRAFT_674228 [Cronartium quercuum f. sp. fusiforme G11]|uniref:Uncharacterized protein n=1 Tax=Cronartium quercuum f. sp. fusiforme G11 TaxID=708437 RepID=A0A9P6NCJ7_9BASI|nr:hypothetical protein CROQUDRAFT_674228 [Cronartium quercuum f. sp. fusiforme G11]
MNPTRLPETISHQIHSTQMPSSVTFGALDACVQEKKDRSNRFHLLPPLTEHGRDRSPSTFNLGFNRRTLSRTELREPSPFGNSAEQSSDNPNPQTCWSILDDSSCVQSRLAQWQFPPEHPVSHRVITWGPYAEATTATKETFDATSCLQTPQHTSVSSHLPDHLPPSPTSAKRPRIQGASAPNTHPRCSRKPKHTRRVLSNRSEAELENQSYPTSHHRFVEVCTLLENLGPHPEPPPPPYSVECPPGIIRQQSTNYHSDDTQSTAHWDRIWPQTPPPSASRGGFQTFSWYRPPTTTDPIQPWWDHSPPAQPFRF